MRCTRNRLVLAALLILASAAAQAQVVRTFVSTSGIDNPDCFLGTPCRTFTAAIAAVAAGGEVVALDSGGYGPFSVDKPVTVLAPEGVYAAIAASSGAAVAVNLTPADSVVLRNLQLYGQGGDYGVLYQGSGELFVDRCVIHGFADTGILTQGFGTFARLYVRDSVVRSNGTEPGDSGLSLSGTFASIEGSVITANRLGLHAGTDSYVSLERSLIAANESYGISPAPNGRVIVVDSMLAHASSGIWAANTVGVARISDTAFVGHVGGLALSQNGSAVIETRENNFGGQDTSTGGAITPIAGQ